METDGKRLQDRLPGWYPDETRPAMLRWWDGRQWSSYSTPAPAKASQRAALAQLPHGAPLPRKRRRVATVLLSGLAAVLGLGGLASTGQTGPASLPAQSTSASAAPAPSAPSVASSPSTTPTGLPADDFDSPGGADEKPTITKKTVVVKYKTVERKDPSLAAGKRKVTTKGRNGKRVDTYEDGVKVSSKVVTKPINRVVVVGTKKSKPKFVYYRNCSAARAAGAAPVYRGEPGYGRHLDRDGDGVGCE
ncbi:excalibur calcium-binding domain-containing protein [Micropruina sp.]|uniref:excalibur calcium-binding domain-containing protein n=1 Tax=Micropruina sp. TaxID=2737536 RepID=UPI00344FF076